MNREALELFRVDPRREAALAIEDHVVCRECGASVADLYSHLRKTCESQLSVAEYRAKWSGAPLRCGKQLKANASYMANLRAADPARERRRSRRWYKLNRPKAIAKQKRYETAHPERVKASRSKTYSKHRTEILERTRQDRQAHPEKYRSRGRRSYANERERAKDRARKRYALLKAALQTVKQRLDPKITMAAALAMQGTTKYDMKRQLFPEQNITEKAYDNVKKFFRRKGSEIEAERQRLMALPLTKRNSEIQRARLRLNPTASTTTT